MRFVEKLRTTARNWAGSRLGDLLTEAADLIEVLEAKVAVCGGEWCAENRAAGRGPCGACAWCCESIRAERDANAAEIARLSANAEKWEAQQEAARARDKRLSDFMASLGEVQHACGEGVGNCVKPLGHDGDHQLLPADYFDGMFEDD